MTALFSFSFQGRIRRPAYALASLATFFSQHLIVFAAFRAFGRPLTADWWFWFVPLTSLARLDHVSNLILVLALAYLMLAAWVLAALAFRRAADGGISEWIAVYAIVPFVQVPVIALLCILPPRSPAEPVPVAEPSPSPDSGWLTAIQGMIAGMALTLFAVAVGALIFGAYGYGVFFVAPFVIGATTGYLVNRKADVGDGRTVTLVLGATALGGIALIIAALEGILCIILAAPLAFFAAVMGGLLGRSIARRARRPARQTLSVVVLLPLIFAIETLLSATTTFDTEQVIGIKAPPAAVWRAIVQMERMDEPPTPPFSLGIAYPLGGEFIGQGVGALRRGEFSTGVALERVVEWAPERILSLSVLNDVPAMQELSPYHHVHAPHVIGYFRTVSMSFELRPRANGETDLVERSSHELRLEPVLYWLPMARWVVHANNARVLAHIRHQAEKHTAD
ncbi:MAG: SRPBCC family protein [Hyphomicrobiales bacterium]|nr:SRPBCC family protein [Hyphomicrobiales bacterium]